MSHQNLLRQIFSVTPGICPHQISLQHLIYHPSAQDAVHHLTTIKSLLKKFQYFYGDHNKHKMMTLNETHLKLGISDLIVYEGLSFDQAQKPRFKKVLDLGKNVSKGY